jgi:hypothetical protein
MTVWDDDERLMQELREAQGAEVSERARSAARAAFTWRTIDQELMRLAYDSSFSSDQVQVRRVGPGPRVLGFEGTGFTLEVEVDAGTVMGQIVPVRAATVSVVTPDGESRSVDIDESGVFSIAAPERGPVRLTVEHDDVASSTGWLSI